MAATQLQHGVYLALSTCLSLFAEVLAFWNGKVYDWWTRRPPHDQLRETLHEARIYEEWEASAFQLDETLGNDLWRQNPTSKYYDYRLIYERLQAIIEAREEEDVFTLVNLLRSGLVRNLGNITSPRLFNRAYAGTKLLIEDYITQVALAVEYVAAYPTSQDAMDGLTSQAKLDLLHDTRQAFGRSALVLQGGAIFGLCHIGVVKALHLRGLLPRIVVGSDTGALIAALVGVHGEDELLDFLTGENLDLSAFAAAGKGVATKTGNDDKPDMFSTALRRLKRFLRNGYLLDIKVLEAAVRANLGDVTFEEAYVKTKRVLNITMPASRHGDMPGLLNYLTAPNVLIWSAAVASNSSSSPLYSSTSLLCKDDSSGQIQPWPIVSPISERSIQSPQNQTSQAAHGDRRRLISTPVSPPTSNDPIRDSPLSRIAELFNVNHFIVSQARPYIAPFLYSESASLNPISTYTRTSLFGWFPLYLPLMRLLGLEIQHRLRQLDSFNLLPSSIRRFLVDEVMPAASITLVPELHFRDFVGLLERPNKNTLDQWIRRGERSVWPAVSALRTRCAVEVELDRCYQIVRRRKPLDGASLNEPPRLKGQGEKRKKAKPGPAPSMT